MRYAQSRTRQVTCERACGAGAVPALRRVDRGHRTRLDSSRLGACEIRMALPAAAHEPGDTCPSAAQCDARRTRDRFRGARRDPPGQRASLGRRFAAGCAQAADHADPSDRASQSAATTGSGHRVIATYALILAAGLALGWAGGWQCQRAVRGWRDYRAAKAQLPVLLATAWALTRNAAVAVLLVVGLAAFALLVAAG